MKHKQKRFEFEVKGQPKPKGRPRFVRRTGATYTPKATMEAQQKVQWAYRAAKGPLFRGPIKVAIRFRKTGQTVEITPLDVGERTFKRGDIDNLAKLTLDALNGLAYEDDRQVVELHLHLETKE